MRRLTEWAGLGVVAAMRKHHAGLAEAAPIASAVSTMSSLCLSVLEDINEVGAEAKMTRREKHLQLQRLMGGAEVACRTAEVSLAVLPGFHLLGAIMSDS